MFYAHLRLRVKRPETIWGLTWASKFCTLTIGFIFCAYREPLRSGIFNNIFDLVSHFDLKIKKKKTLKKFRSNILFKCKATGHNSFQACTDFCLFGSNINLKLVYSEKILCVNEFLWTVLFPREAKKSTL